MIVDYQYYIDNGYNLLNEDNCEKYLNQSTRQINILCKNRLFNGIFEKYTEATQNVVKNIICEHAEYLSDNDNGNTPDNGIIKKYTNGSASVEYDNATRMIKNIGGIQIKTSLYDELILTGLCYRGFY